MKNLLFVVFFVSIYSIVCSQNSVKNQTYQSVITFSDKTHDFGDIIESNGKVTYSFEVTNTGNEVLLITNVQGSCGCAVSEWTKEPVAPGKKGFIKITYNPENRLGPFSKNVTVSNNSGENPVTLVIKGNVIRKDTK